MLRLGTARRRAQERLGERSDPHGIAQQRRHAVVDVRGQAPIERHLAQAVGVALRALREADEGEIHGLAKLVDTRSRVRKT